MSVKELQKYTYYAKYARYNKNAKRRETWNEAVDRMKTMHLKKYPQIKDEIDWAFKLVNEQKVLGSQRALQFGGEPIEKKHARIYNCCVSYCDRLRFFQETFWLLLCGCGTGFSVQRHHIDKLPALSRNNKTEMPFTFTDPKVFKVPDSIEGWADALGVLLSSYFENPIFPEYAQCNVVFDYSDIRPAGSPLASSAGKAPGPKPLENALEKIRKLLDRCVADGKTKLHPIDAYDVVMHSSDAVLSGGVRRSATICIFSKDDEEMLKAKTGNWYYENPQRARSNNSVLLLRNETTQEHFDEIMKSIKEFGEPGFVLADSTEILLNPCCEIGMWPVDETTGLSGWQMCNLSEINGKLVKSRQDFIYAAIAASIIGTLQAGYTSFPYLGEVTERIVKRESLLGVSITGMMDSPDILFNPELQREAAAMVAFTNRRIAERIGINPAARATCIKPSGTASCLLGSASGIHAHHSKRYFRRVQANKMEACYQYFASVNSDACENSVWSANNTDGVISFCVEAPEEAKTKAHIDAVTLLKYVKLTQQNWVKEGCEPRLCTQPWLSHNVSNTINVLPDEWDAVSKFIYDNKNYFTAVSLLPASGDKDYEQAPFTAVFTDEELKEMYDGCFHCASELYQEGIKVFGKENFWRACDIANGVVALKMGDRDKEAWVDNVRSLAARSFNGDVKKATYCLKDMHHNSEWKKLKASYKEVHYEDLIEEQDNTKPMETAACAGGMCEVNF